MDKTNRGEVFEIVKKEFIKSETYCNWRSGSDLKNVNQAKVLFEKKKFDTRKMLLRIKEIPEVTESLSFLSRQPSLTNSEYSITSSQYSPNPTHEKKKTYWSILRGKLKRKILFSKCMFLRSWYTRS